MIWGTVAPSQTPSSDKFDLVLVNPTAGGGKAKECLNRLREFAKSSRWRAQFRIADDAEDLARLACAAAREPVARVFALGGDGTFQVVLNELISTEIPLGVIPAGGGNDFASAIGLPADGVEAAKLLQSGTVRKLDVARVKFEDSTERYYAGGAGIGLDAAAARIANGDFRHMHGRLRYLLSAIRALFSFQSIPVEVEVVASSAEKPANRLHVRALVLAVLNTPTYGAGLRLAPEANLQDGLLDLVLFEDRSLLRILPLIPGLLVSGELHTNEIHRERIRRLRVVTRQPYEFQADGEILGRTPVEIEVVPGALNAVCPR